MFYGSLNKLKSKKESDMTEIQYHLSSIQEIIKSTENPSEIWKVINKNNLIQLQFDFIFINIEKRLKDFIL